MTRHIAVLLALVAAASVSQVDHAPAVAQDKKKDKKKDKAPDAPDGALVDDGRLVTPVFDPGAHTQAVLAMGFSKDGSRLVTVGRDYTVQVWGAATGERLDLLRLPGYGREKGFDTSTWNIAAVSADGARVAIGGQPKYVNDAAEANTARLLLIDVVKRTVTRVAVKTGRNRPVTAVAFSPTGNTLAFGVERGPKEDAVLVVVGDLAKRQAAASPLVQTADCHQLPLAATANALSFSSDGKRLLVAAESGPVQVWDVPPGAAPISTKAKDVAVAGITTSLAWAPDGKRFARTATGVKTSNTRKLELWDADGTPIKSWTPADLVPAVESVAQLYTVQFLTADALYFTANGPVEKGGNGSIGGVLDLTTGKATRFAASPEGMPMESVGAVSASGTLALAVGGNTEVLIGKPGAPPVRCGNRSPIPFHVGWAKDAAAPAIAWTDVWTSTGAPPGPMKYGFDLRTVQPLREIGAAASLLSTDKLDGWELKFGPDAADDGKKTTVALKKGDQTLGTFQFVRKHGHTLVPNGNNPPLVAHAEHVRRESERLWLFKGDGARVARLLPDATNVNDIAASPDGRYILATSGTPRLNVYRTDGTIYPLLSFAQLNGDWVAWTQEGYFAASPGGEKMFGWAVHNGPNALVTFHPAERFAKHYRRPDVIKLAIETGTVKAALEALNAKAAPEVETILPPGARLALVAQPAEGRVKVKALAESRGPGKPVLAMRVLLDGRPLANGAGVWTPGPNEAEFEVDIPPGQHELKLLARSADGSAVSDPVVVRGPKAGGPPQTLYRVCVGIDAYDQSGLKLSTATKDARDVFAALGRHCVGPDNRYAAAEGELILDKEATRDRVKQSLETFGKKAKSGDLFVVFFAGHGVKKGETYYLLTRESDPAADLSGKALSGDDLRGALAGVECPVLLALDACHSAGASPALPAPKVDLAKVVLPGADALTRDLTSDTVGVTVLSAAMAHETAGSSAGNGHFTAGLLKGLEAGTGVPFDPYERAVYVHHLYSVVFSEVRRATGGRQNPFLNMPWTAPPLAVRDVPQ